MRRVKSAPANLCSLAHSKRATPPALEDQALSSAEPIVLVSLMRQEDAMDQVVTASLENCEVVDPTEQFFILLLMRRLMSFSESQGLQQVMSELLIRSAMSYTVHQLMAWTFATLHNHGVDTGLKSLLGI